MAHPKPDQVHSPSDDRGHERDDKSGHGMFLVEGRLHAYPRARPSKLSGGFGVEREVVEAGDGAELDAGGSAFIAGSRGTVSWGIEACFVQRGHIPLGSRVIREGPDLQPVLASRTGPAKRRRRSEYWALDNTVPHEARRPGRTEDAVGRLSAFRSSARSTITGSESCVSP